MNKLSTKTHLSLLIMSFLTWGLFVLVGLPDYGQSWDFNLMVILVIAITVAYVPIGDFILKKMFPDNRYFKNSIWLAFYLTIPLFIYDVIFIAIIGGEGLQFLPKYWYLTFFYFSFWIQFPLIGLLKEHNLNEEV